MSGWASRFGATILLALSLPLASCARTEQTDMTARFVAEDGSGRAITAYVDASGWWRVDDQNGDVTIARDGQVFVITRDTPAGPPFVLRKHDLDAASAARQRDIEMTLKLPPPPADMASMLVDIIEGGPKTVGRWPGTGYSFGVREGLAAGGTMGDLVVSRDPALAPLGKALAAFLAVPDPRPKMMEGTNIDLKMAELAGKGCLIKFSGVRLDTIASGPVNPRLFDLPAAPLSRAAVDDLVRRRTPIPDLSSPTPAGKPGQR